MRWLIVVLLTCWVVPPGAWAQTNSGDKQKPSATTKNKTAKPKPGNSKSNAGVAVSPQEESAVTAFVQQHHPALLELLIHLKESLPKEYQQAIRDLSRTQERLSQYASRDPQRYELELKLWQAQSRGQLLAARLQMGGDETLREQLKATIREEYDLRISLLKHERERLTGRVGKLDEQIEKQEKNRDSAIEREFALLTKPVAGASRNVKSDAKKVPAKTAKDPT